MVPTTAEFDGVNETAVLVVAFDTVRVLLPELGRLFESPEYEAEI
ncbi:MAG: hypothetical protein ACREBI_04355 [Nitrosotalea sp.]